MSENLETKLSSKPKANRHLPSLELTLSQGFRPAKEMKIGCVYNFDLVHCSKLPEGTNICNVIEPRSGISTAKVEIVYRNSLGVFVSGQYKVLEIYR